MLTTDPLSALLKKLGSNKDVTNHLYLLIDGSSSVKREQFNLMKRTYQQLLSFFDFGGCYTTKVSIIQFASTFIFHTDSESDFSKIANVLEGINPMGGGTDPNNALLQIQARSTQLTGNKTILICTDGDVNCKNTINYFIANDYNVICFLVRENGAINETPVVEAFGNTRLIVFDTFAQLEEFFERVICSKSEAPTMIIRNVCTREIILQVKSNVKYQAYEVQGFAKSNESQMRTLARSEVNHIVIKDLEPNQAYCLQIRGAFHSKNFTANYRKEVNMYSEFSPVIEVKTIQEHRLGKTLEDPGKRQEAVQKLRTKYQNFKIPAPLEEAGIELLTFCLFGEMGNGKSSTINTIITALLNDDRNPVEVAAAGKNGKTFTMSITDYDIYPNVPIRMRDVWGWQASKDYKEFEALIKGQLRSTFKEGDAIDPSNPSYNSQPEINDIPQGYLTVVDISSAYDTDKVKRFSEFYKMFKQVANKPVLVAMTKFDNVCDKEGEDVLNARLEKVYNFGSIRETMEGFAHAAGLSPFDIFPLMNYHGKNSERSDTKDLIALNIFDRLITSILDSLKTNVVLRIVDQNNARQCSLLLPTSDLDKDLNSFDSSYSSKMAKSNVFDPDGYYDQRIDSLIQRSDYTKVTLKRLVYDKRFEEDIAIYTLKVNNRIAKTVLQLVQPTKIIEAKSHPEDPKSPALSQASSIFNNSTRITQVFRQQSSRVIFRCSCGKWERRTGIRSTNITDLRNELKAYGSAFNHIEKDSVFLDRQGYDVLEWDEDEAAFEDLVSKGKDDQEIIHVKCSGC